MRRLVPILLLLVMVGCVRSPSPSEHASTEIHFSVHLQEGFSGELVRITTGGRLLFEGKPVTDPRLGVAEQVQCSTKFPLILLTVEIPSRQLKSSHAIGLSEARVVGLSVVAGKVKVVQAKAFGYD